MLIVSHFMSPSGMKPHEQLKPSLSVTELRHLLGASLMQMSCLCYCEWDSMQSNATSCMRDRQKKTRCSPQIEEWARTHDVELSTGAFQVTEGKHWSFKGKSTFLEKRESSPEEKVN